MLHVARCMLTPLVALMLLARAAPFGIVTLADSTDEGWGCNVSRQCQNSFTIRNSEHVIVSKPRIDICVDTKCCPLM